MSQLGINDGVFFLPLLNSLLNPKMTYEQCIPRFWAHCSKKKKKSSTFPGGKVVVHKWIYGRGLMQTTKYQNWIKVFFFCFVFCFVFCFCFVLFLFCFSFFSKLFFSCLPIHSKQWRNFASGCPWAKTGWVPRLISSTCAKCKKEARLRASLAAWVQGPAQGPRWGSSGRSPWKLRFFNAGT